MLKSRLDLAKVLGRDTARRDLAPCLRAKGAVRAQSLGGAYIDGR
jgi:hypothetical protein